MAEPLTGAQAEQLACDHLLRAGLALVERNYRCPRGEIDLILRDGDTLVFVEVRYRKNDRYGSASESVTAGKRGRIETAANHYLTARHLNEPCRFDVVALSGQPPRIDWLRDAFQAG